MVVILAWYATTGVVLKQGSAVRGIEIYRATLEPCEQSIIVPEELDSLHTTAILTLRLFVLSSVFSFNDSSAIFFGQCPHSGIPWVHACQQDGRPDYIMCILKSAIFCFTAFIQIQYC